MRYRRWRLGLCIVVGLAVVATPASAATITVANTNDSGPGSLRQAISAASGGDTISIPGGLYKLASVLTVSKSLTFVGAGARTAILDGQHATQIFNITAPAASVTISGLTMRNGNTASSGGAISSSVPLTLTDDAVTGSTAADGGGILASNRLTMDRDLVAGNVASAGYGGGIEYQPPSPVTSTISDTTVTQNSSMTTGGGINEENSSTETLNLLNDSLVANTSAQGGNFRAWSGTTITFANTLIAQGSAASEPNCAYGGGATVTSLGHNAQDINDPNCNFTSSDLTNINPMLSNLQDNGGATETLLPAATSPLIDAGASTHCTTSDQRGVPRPQGGGCDIGAAERTTPSIGAPAVSSITATSATVSATVNSAYIGGTFAYHYGVTSAYGSSTSPQALTAGPASQTATATLAGLSPATTYHFQVIVTTPDGTAASTDVAFTTQATPPPPPVTPAISGLGVSPSRFSLAGRKVHGHCVKATGRRGAKHCRRTISLRVGYTLNVAATVTITLERQAAGRMVNGRCVKATKKNRRHRRCTLMVGVPGRIVLSGTAGANRFTFNGRIGGHQLAPAAYELIATPAGGAPRTAAFKIVP